MSAEILELADVEAISNDVWGSFLMTGAEPSSAGVPLTESDLVRASIQSWGAWDGRVVIEMAPATAHAMTATMLGLGIDEAVAPDEVEDAVGELVNMIGGNIKSLMPSPSSLGLPVVSRESGAGGGVEEARQLCDAELAWAGAPVRVRVWSTRAR
ncbi:MAG: chemotaxis protein CheX [Nocardioides sp.]